MNTFTHVIWDMDGVLVDSERHWNTGENFFLAEEIDDWGNFDQSRLVGRSLRDIYEMLREEYDLTLTYKEYESKYNAVAEKVYRHEADLMPHARDVLIDLQGRNTVQLLVSSSTHYWIQMAVDRFHLKQYFKYIISAEDVGGKGKPAPDIYNYASDKLSAAKRSILVIEDSKPGVKAAQNAGLQVIGYDPEATGVLTGLAPEIIHDLREVLPVVQSGMSR